jgi:tetratricopeptide (TPR) repeat protein
MLANLLPGVRQVRTPFASGVLWIIFGWLLLSNHITRSDAPRLFRSVNSLGSALKPLGIGFSVTLGGYLVGALFEAIWGPLYRVLPALSPNGRRSIYRLVTRRVEALPRGQLAMFAACRSYGARSRFGENQLLMMAEDPDSWDQRRRARDPNSPHDWTVERYRRHEETDNHDDDELFGAIRDFVTRDLISSVQEELDVIGTRLLSTNKDLFNIYDMLHAEAQFRTAIAVPAAAVIAVVLRDLLPWPLILLVTLLVLILFFVEARGKKMAAGDRIVDALRIDAVSAPSLEEVKPGVYTTEALRADQIQVATNSRSADQLYRILGVPATRRIGIAVSNAVMFPVHLVASGVVAGGRAVMSALGAVTTRAVSLGRSTRFVVRDLRINRGRVLMARWQMMRSRLPETETQRRLGALYRRYGYFDKAVSVYGGMGIEGNELQIDSLEEKHAELEASKRPQALQELMDRYVEAGDLDRAERICRRAIANKQRAARILLGDLMSIRGDTGRARQEYRRAGRAGLAQGWERLGDLCAEMGDIDAARDWYRRARDGGRETSGDKLAKLQDAADVELATAAPDATEASVSGEGRASGEGA